MPFTANPPLVAYGCNAHHKTLLNIEKGEHIWQFTMPQITYGLFASFPITELSHTEGNSTVSSKKSPTGKETKNRMGKGEKS